MRRLLLGCLLGACGAAGGGGGGPEVLLRSSWAVGSFTYPPYGGPYDNHVDVAVVIECTGWLQVAFTAYDVELGDRVSVNGVAMPVVQEYHKPEPLGTQGVGDNVVRFKSDWSGTGEGFQLTWTCPKACWLAGVPIEVGAAGRIKYPSWGALYANNAKDCWQLDCAGDLLLNFTRFDVDGGDAVTVNGAAVSRDAGQRVVALETVLPELLPDPVRAAGRTEVGFASDYVSVGGGFDLQWACCAAGSGCAGEAAPPPSGDERPVLAERRDDPILEAAGAIFYTKAPPPDEKGTKGTKGREDEMNEGRTKGGTKAPLPDGLPDEGVPGTEGPAPHGPRPAGWAAAAAAAAVGCAVACALLARQERARRGGSSGLFEAPRGDAAALGGSYSSLADVGPPGGEGGEL